MSATVYQHPLLAPQKSLPEAGPRISYHSLQVAISVLEGVIANYLPLYEVSWKEGFRHYPLLVFVEALIINAEEAMEEAATARLDDPLSHWRRTQSDIISLLAAQQCDHPEIKRYVGETEEFFNLVHSQMYEQQITGQSVARSLELAAGDFCLLHAILGRLLGKNHEEDLFQCLKPLEILREFKWYLENFDNDLQRSRFNIFILCHKLYGDNALNQIMSMKSYYESCLQGILPKTPQRVRSLLDQQVANYNLENDNKSFAEQLAVKLNSKCLNRK